MEDKPNLKKAFENLKEELRLRFTSQDAKDIAEFLKKSPSKDERLSLWIKKLEKQSGELSWKENYAMQWIPSTDRERKEYRSPYDEDQ